jgi:hypothetical protein
MSVNISRASETNMSSIDLPTLILTQIPTRTRLADTRALMQLVQAVAEQEWEREINEEAEKVKEEG